MQRTRESANNILQIRVSMPSNKWDYIWQEMVLSALRIVA
jgi:hypothetical protein